MSDSSTGTIKSIRATSHQILVPWGTAIHGNGSPCSLVSCRAHQVSWRKQVPIQIVVPLTTKSESHNVKQEHDSSCLDLCLGLTLHWKAADLCYTKIPTKLPSQADLGLQAFCADFPIPLGKMGQPPLAALPKAQWYAETRSSSFPLCNCYAIPPLFSETAAREMPGRTSQELQFHPEAKHHPSAAGSQSPEAGAEQLLIGSSWWQNLASLQGNPSWLFLSSGRILTSSCVAWNKAH